MLSILPDQKTPSMNNKFNIILSLTIIILIAAMIVIYNHVYQWQIGPEQPIPFSHRVHNDAKNISCYFCHEGAIDHQHAGIPPSETCMLCHERIIIHHPEIKDLHEYHNNNEPIMWEKVNELPDFVYFNHSVHIFRQQDCAECHGNVMKMDRIEQYTEFTMEFCIDCHRDFEASEDCFTCHR
jgi:hypothetical protein